MTLSRPAALAVLCLACGMTGSAIAEPFTYQGELRDAAGPVNGTCDFTFNLYATQSSTFVLGTDTATGVAVADGLFTVQLDFGAGTFDGQTRWLEPVVTCGSDPAATLPRQQVTASPYAITSFSTEGLQGTPVSATAPADGEVLKFNEASGAWEPATDTSGSGDITAVTAGSGLSGGGTQGEVTLNADTGVMQARVTGTCTGGQKVIAINQDGSVQCGPDTDTDTNTGDLTVQGGNFISGGGSAGSVTLDLDAIACDPGDSIESINSDGSVTCSEDSVGSITQYVITCNAGLNEVSQCIAACPTGTKVTGGGCRALPGGSNHIITSRPASPFDSDNNTADSPNGWFCNTALMRTNDGDSPYTTGYAICVDIQ